jgi:hypothetical protein
MIPTLFHHYPDVATERIIRELRFSEQWDAKKNSLKWMIGEPPYNIKHCNIKHGDKQ